MKWIKNMESLGKINKVGRCPYCGSDNTSFNFTFLDIDAKVGYGDMWCNSCWMAYHISRMVYNGNFPTGLSVPKNLQY